MEDSLGANQFRECINKFRELDRKMQEIEYEIQDTRDCTNACLQGVSIADFSDKMSSYVEQIRQIRESIKEFEKNLESIEEVCTCEALPLFNFIISDIGAWWKQAYPVIEQISTVSGAITGAATITVAPFTFIKWVRGKLQEKRDKNEYAWIKLILAEDEWNTSVLSKKLDLSEDETKRILKGFGYKWNSSKMLYVSTESTQKLRNIEIRESIIY